MSHHDAYPQSAAFQAGFLTPEQVARQLFSGTSLRARQRSHLITMNRVAQLRRAYVAGVAARGDAWDRAFYDEAENRRPGRVIVASSYDDMERRVFAWGVEDADNGRYATP